jgi:UDP-glucose 4-epimerase
VSESWLITGSHGCIGAWAARILVREKATVTAFDIAADRHRLELVMEPDELERIRFVRGDVTELEALERVLDHPACA